MTIWWSEVQGAKLPVRQRLVPPPLDVVREVTVEGALRAQAAYCAEPPDGVAEKIRGTGDDAVEVLDNSVTLKVASSLLPQMTVVLAGRVGGAATTGVGSVDSETTWRVHRLVMLPVRHAILPDGVRPRYMLFLSFGSLIRL